MLRQNGYMTAWIGKNHNTPTWETSAAGPFDRWANGLGFDYFYGFNAGDMNHWNPVLYENRNLVPASTDPNYHLTEDLADKSIAWVRKVKEHRPGQAVLPLRRPRGHALPAPRPEGLDREVQGQVRRGLGQVPRGDVRAAEEARRRPAGHEADRALGGAARVGLAQRRPEAALRPDDGGVRRPTGRTVDHHMGRVIDAVKQLPDADNTLFIYIAGDNGASAEGGLEGSLNENLFFNGFPEKWQDNLKAIDELGGPKHFNHFPSAWAHAMDTPFQWTKQVASHFGGTRNPMIVSWPARIKDKGGLREQFHHVIDVVPTIYEACGDHRPDRAERRRSRSRSRGPASPTRSTTPRPRAGGRRSISSWACNRGIYHDGWMASALSFAPWEPIREGFDPDKQKWELYNIDEDFSPGERPGDQSTARSSGSCRTSGGSRRRSTTSCRWTGGAVTG